MSIGETYVIRIYRLGECAAARDGGTTPQMGSSDRYAFAGRLKDPVTGETRALRAISQLIAMLLRAWA